MNLPEITPHDARARLESGDGNVYLDVRTVAEFEKGHPPGAWNVPVMSRHADGRMAPNDHFLRVVEATLPKGAMVISGCRSGRRSARAASIMLQAGYTNVVNMVGGFSGAHDPSGQLLQPGWSTLNFPTTTGNGGEKSYDALRREPAL